MRELHVCSCLPGRLLTEPATKTVIWERLAESPLLLILRSSSDRAQPLNRVFEHLAGDLPLELRALS